MSKQSCLLQQVYADLILSLELHVKLDFFFITDISSEVSADLAQTAGTSTKYQFAGFSRGEDAVTDRGAGKSFCIVFWQRKIQLDFLQFFEDVLPVTQEASSLLNEPMGTPEVEVLCWFTESCR